MQVTRFTNMVQLESQDVKLIASIMMYDWTTYLYLNFNDATVEI